LFWFVQGEPSFPLVDVPDHQLDEEGLKEKRRQKLMKAGHDARERAKAEREAEKSRQVSPSNLLPRQQVHQLN
jgi:actin-related protein 5